MKRLLRGGVRLACAPSFRHHFYRFHPFYRFDRFYRIIALIALTACTPSPPEQPNSTYTYSITHFPPRTTSGLRGVSVVNANVAWASGTRGVVLRTMDGGQTWADRRVSGADSVDFRDIEAFDSLTAYVLSAGEDGRIYKTTDGGRSWNLQFQNTVKGAFFDCFDFWDDTSGIVLSDPVDGLFLLLRTDDGQSWRQLPRSARPASLEGEAAFAASGTCVVAAGDRRVLLATGGGPEARILISADAGDSWRAVATPVAAGAASAGIFSLAFRDDQNGIAIGGDYQNSAAEAVVAITTDSGGTWRIAGRTAYVSGAAFSARTNTVIAVGTKGTRASRDRGVTWFALDTLEYNAVQLAADGNGYAVGPRGRIAKLIAR